MQNIEMKMEGDTLVIKIDTEKRFGKSKSEKSTIVASTNGNVTIPDHPEIKIGINAYTKE
jgi:hypothetical protein